MSPVASSITLFGGATDAPVGAARARRNARVGALVTLTDTLENKGFGEASPLPGFSPESLSDAVNALSDALALVTDESLEDPIAALTQRSLDPLTPSARFAFETALLDLVARRRGVPLHRLLSDREASPVPVNAYVGAALDDGLIERTEAALSRGVDTIKVKLAGDSRFEAELAALQELRARASGRWSLRLDANAAWTLSAARRNLRALAALDVAFVEQPVAPGELRELGECDVPWAIDESLTDRADTDFVLREGRRSGCSAVILKPALHGLLRARELGVSASNIGLDVVVTHLFDGPVALASACELALSLPSVIACGLDHHSGLSAWPATAIAQRRDRALVTPADSPGLALSIAP